MLARCLEDELNFFAESTAKFVSPTEHATAKTNHEGIHTSLIGKEESC